MTQDFDPVAGAEAPVVETATEPGNVQQAVEPKGDETTEQALYEDDLPEGEEGRDEQLDDDELEPIEAPASLKAEEKEQFAQLPPEAQRFAAEVLKRRDQETQQGLEAARSAQRQAEASAADHAAQVQQQFAAQAAQLVQAFQPTPPPVELARSDPAEYQYLKAIYDEQLGTYNELVRQIAGLHTQSEQHFGAQRQAWMQEQVNQLRSIPEFADDAKRPEFQRALADVGKELGFSDEELAGVGAKEVFALNKVKSWKADAEKWRQHQSRRNQRPRAAQGRFAAAPVGNGAPARAPGVNDTLKALYPND